MDFIKMILFYLLVSAIFVLPIYFAIKRYTKKLNKQKEEYKKLPSYRITLYDILFISKKGKKHTKTTTLAVYKDTSNNQLYIPGKVCYLANPLISYSWFIGEAPKIVVRAHNQKQIEPSAPGKIYVSHSIGSVLVNGNEVTIENMKCIYKGSIHEPNSLSPVEAVEIRNSVTNPDLLKELNNATIIDGLIEFDIENF